MKLSDAVKVLGLSGDVTPKDVKAAYRKAAMKYHPDRNPAGADMMKIINAAYHTLKDYSGEVPTSEEESTQDYPEAVNDALNVILGLDGLEVEICGAWVWVSGDTFKHKTILKEAAFKYASKKKSWYFRPDDWNSSSRGSYSMDEIRGKYGSAKPSKSNRKVLQGGG